MVLTSSPSAAPERHRPDAATIAALGERLLPAFGNRLSASEAVRRHHSNTLAWGVSQPPDLVVFPTSTEEVATLVGLCADMRVPVIPYGAGSSFEGHVNAPFGGVSIDTSLMNRLLAVHAEDLDCVIEPGLTRKALNEQLRDTGLFFPIDPGADASLGGMAATRASGTNAVRYGTMRDNVIALTAVMPDGSVVRTASRARKSSAGYDLTRLLIGSEGTLGVITELTLKLYGVPEAIAGGICPFPSVRAACDAAILCIQSGLPVARVELADALLIRATNLHAKLGLRETPMLFVEFHGTEAGVAEQAERFATIASEFGGGPFDWATRPEDRSRLWQARHDAYWATVALRPGCATLATDVCVPISRLADCVEETQRDLADSGIVAPILGHVGDGNFHLTPLVDTHDADEVSRMRDFLSRLVDRALAMEGTCTGEHGIGQDKMKYMPREHSAATLAVMRAVKRSIDPLDIMNPGKIVAD
jgi:D-lactate dehydrogenase (cytochrome)